MHRTGHLGQDFLRAEHISCYTTGDVIEMNETKAEENWIGIHEDGRELSALFSTSLSPHRFGKITQAQANMWRLKGIVAYRWNLLAFFCLKWGNW